MPVDVDLDKFKHWLLTENAMQPRSAKDVVSRFRRLMRMGLTEKDIKSEKIKDLYRSDDFSNLSMSVKSQLKRSANLYIKYLENE